MAFRKAMDGKKERQESESASNIADVTEDLSIAPETCQIGYHG